MEAKFRFYLKPNENAADDERLAKALKIIQADDCSDDEKEWYRKNAKALNLPPNHLGRVYWDGQRKQIYLCNWNRTGSYDFKPDGFETPDFVAGLQDHVDEIEAEVFFFSRKKLQEGIYQRPLEDLDPLSNLIDWVKGLLGISKPNIWFGISEGICGVLHYELLSDGRPRYRLLVKNAQSLVDLSGFVRRLRSKKIQPWQAWS